jgi:anti-anti-sigma factor
MASTRVTIEKLPKAVMAVLETEAVNPFDLAPLEHDLKEAARASAWRIGVDMSKVEILGSQGLGMLINLRKDVVANKGMIVLCNISPEILESLKITKLAGLFVIAKDKQAAAAALA